MSASIVIVDDEPEQIQVLAQMLSDLGEIYVCTSGLEALAMVRQRHPDLVLLDANMPDMNGFDVCAQLKEDAELADIPVIFVTAQDAPEFEVSGFDHGAADFIAKPVQRSIVRARVKTQLKVKQMGDALRQTAAEDALTGLANRRYFDTILRKEIHIAQRRGEFLTLGLVDVDHFKLYNDHYGHPAGDDCLCAIARALVTACQRPSDLVARIGGEEFALILPQTSLESSALVAVRVMNTVAALNLAHHGIATDARVSISMGLALYSGISDRHEIGPSALQDHDDETAAIGSRLLAKADKALYVAKRSGRNRVCTANPAEADTQMLVIYPSAHQCVWEALSTEGVQKNQAAA